MIDLETHVAQLHRDGYLVLPGVLSPEEVAVLRAGVERAFAEPNAEALLYGAGMSLIWRPKMFEQGPEFAQGAVVAGQQGADGLVQQVGDLAGQLRAFLALGLDGFFTDHPFLGRKARDAYVAP